MTKSKLNVLLQFVCLTNIFAGSDISAGPFFSSVGRTTKNIAEETVELGRKTKTKVTDASITTAIKTSFGNDEYIEARHIDIDTRSGKVYLKGRVRTEEDMQRALTIAKQTKGVKQVFNELAIDPKL